MNLDDLKIYAYTLTKSKTDADLITLG